MNENKFCFILCVNDELYMKEAVLYIERLYVPEGYEVEFMEIAGASSMAGGYNEGMKASDSKYKIYMHQDVFILNQYFLYDILELFHCSSRIGMIGMVGTEKMPSDGIMWHAERCGGSGGYQDGVAEGGRYCMRKQGYQEVEAIDGFMMVTQYDIVWQEEIFDGWDFYDISQSYQMSRAGYLVVVPNQIRVWCLHDDKAPNMLEYNKYRQLFLEKYGG